MKKEERSFIQKLYIERMINHLPMLRASVKLTQNQLSKKLAITRGTMVAYESRQRPLPWTTYMAMVLLFLQYEDSRKLLESFDIFDSDKIKLF